MAIRNVTDPDYRRELGDGLVARWSTKEDTEAIAQFSGRVFAEKADGPLDEHVISLVRNCMREDFFMMGPGDFALVEDTSRAGSPVVACTCLMRATWEFEGVSIPMGQPEIVASAEEYRNRGLIRELFQIIHARSEAEGHLVQAIAGIPHFYRQFGYEYALELGGQQQVPVESIPKATGLEPFTLRPATEADLPIAQELHNRQSQWSSVWSVAGSDFWREQLVPEGEDPHLARKESRLFMLVDQEGATAGYVLTLTRRGGDDVAIPAVNLVEGVSWRAVLPSLLREIRRYGESLPAPSPEAGPVRKVTLRLGSSHPLYEALSSDLMARYWPPYAWYVRVPDLLALLKRLAPALEKRLAGSAMANYSGELKLDFYRHGLRLIFECGHLRLVEPWRADRLHSDAGASCPSLVFLQLLFGYRSLDELRAAFPDVRAEGEAELVLKALFPRRFSRVMPQL